MAVVISWPVAAYVFLVLAVIFALMFALTFTARFIGMALPMDGEAMNEEPTLDVQNHKGDR
jgi:hypothetical protein